MDFNQIDEEEIKTKGKMYAITTLSFISAIIIFLIISIFSSKQVMNEILKNPETYYFIDIDENNKDQILTLLEKNNSKYCESMYKVEYAYSFPHYANLKIYCKNNENIDLYESNKELNAFIKENGEKGER